jgi:opacity protein-like surface antigen
VFPNSTPLASCAKLAALAAVLAAVALTLVLASPAPASSGGIGTGTTGPTGSGSTSGGSKYKRLWDRVSAADKRWARSTSECESGNDPDAIGGGGAYRGAFQFTMQTWRTSPKTPGGDPVDYDYRTQAVVAVALKRQAGTSPWPVCG